MPKTQCDHPICQAIEAMLRHGPISLIRQDESFTIEWSNHGDLNRSRGTTISEALETLLQKMRSN